MTEFDFDVITGPSGPIRSGNGACAWVSAETPGPHATSPLEHGSPSKLERPRHGPIADQPGGDAGLGRGGGRVSKGDSGSASCSGSAKPPGST
jgi:hypothetical protein